MPRNAVLITFDDGYRDTFSVAMPELVKFNMPSVLFAAAGFIGGFAVPFWDWVTEAFLATRSEKADLPLLGARMWRSRADRINVANEWIKRGIDYTEHAALRDALNRLSSVLGHPLPFSAPPDLLMNWDELRAMAATGMAIGAHSVMHPVLPQTNAHRAAREIRLSKAVIEHELGRTVASFAYPNGLFTKAHENMLAQANYTMGFRVDGGLTFTAEMKARPFAIRRSCITLKDDLPRFAAKVAGLSRFS